MKTKNILRAFLTLVFVLGIGAMNAQDKIYVHKKDGTGAEFNLADIDSISFTPLQGNSGKVLDGCESLDGWGLWHSVPGESASLSLDTEDKKQGNSSMKVDVAVGGTWTLEKKPAPFDTEVTLENGYLAFEMYISDVDILKKAAHFMVTISSSGTNDADRIFRYQLNSLSLNNGWNTVELKLSDQESTGTCNLKAINYFRFLINDNTNYAAAPLVLKFDNIRFYE